MIDAHTHVPVLLRETLAGLAIRPDGVYVDATFGRGGHARAILAALGERGRLLALDRDPAAEREAATIVDPRFTFVRAWFGDLRDVAARQGIANVHGILFDLGVSSPQLDDPQRGFSYRFDGPLDMRMDPTRGESAADFIARASVRELTEVIRDHGEERFAQSIARAIAAARARAPIVTTRQLATVVAQAVGARTRGDWSQDPAARTFQALRIAVNDELHELSMALPLATGLLAPGGRLAVISFHSLEDRVVKRFIATASKPFGGDPRLARVPLKAAELPVAPLQPVGRAIKASERETAVNPRARSAVLRIAERSDASLPSNWPHGVSVP
jgi:16S rRNA (cytosine1402-N4)-methyltransferase